MSPPLQATRVEAGKGGADNDGKIKRETGLGYTFATLFAHRDAIHSVEPVVVREREREREREEGSERESVYVCVCVCVCVFVYTYIMSHCVLSIGGCVHAQTLSAPLLCSTPPLPQSSTKYLRELLSIKSKAISACVKSWHSST